MSYPNLKAEMARHGVSQQQVADATNKSVRTVNSWLNGNESRIAMEDAVSLQEAFFPQLGLKYLFATSLAETSAKVSS